MNENEDFILVRIRRRIAYLISNILRGASVEPHFKASKERDPTKIDQLRQEGDDIHRVAKDIEEEMNKR